MYLTAHRVVSPRSRREGINAFRYVHGDSAPIDWTAPDVLSVSETQPGTLTAEAIEVAPGGNLVRSYLDVATHDSTPIPVVETALDALRSKLGGSLPASLSGPVSARFGMEAGLEGDARTDEFDTLRDRVLALMREPRPSWRTLEPLTVEMNVSPDETSFRFSDAAAAKLSSLAPAWRPARIRVEHQVRDDLGLIHGDVLRELIRALLPPAVTEEDLLALGGIRVVDLAGKPIAEWPSRQTFGTGYCLNCHRHNTLAATGTGFQCAFCGHVQARNGLWVATLG